MSPFITISLVILTCVLSVGRSHAAVKGGDCFDRHLLEAIESNEGRLPLYDRESGGRTSPILNRLIFLERGARLTNWIYFRFDSRSQPYQDNGIALMCEEFVEMSLTPEWVARAAQPWPRLADYRKPDASRMRRALEQALETGGFEALTRAAVAEVEALAHQPGTNCMIRHVLESIARMAWLAPQHAIRAEQIGLPSPLPISRDLAESHFLLIRQSIELDAAAAPIQADGIPVLCQDVPPIPLPPLQR